MRLYHALWDAYEHPAAPPSAGPRACPDGYEQARACRPRMYPTPCSQEQATHLQCLTCMSLRRAEGLQQDILTASQAGQPHDKAPASVDSCLLHRRASVGVSR